MAALPSRLPGPPSEAEAAKGNQSQKYCQVMCKCLKNGQMFKNKVISSRNPLLTEEGTYIDDRTDGY